MQIDRRITNGLAWAGALLVIGVPTADLLSAQFFGPRDAQVAVADAPTPAPAAQRPAAPTQQTAAVTPAATGDAVGTFQQSGRKLPSYITGGTDTPAPTQAAAPVPVATAAPSAPAAPAQMATANQPAAARPTIVTDPVQTASIPPRVAPTPMPLSMRPRPVIATMQPSYQQPSRPQQVVIPPAVASQQPVQITADDLADWETGPLSDFLASRQPQPQRDPNYVEGGAYLDQIEGSRQRDRYIGPVDEPLFFPFTN